MAEQFIQIPYVGYDPSSSYVSENGISGYNGSTKIACCIDTYSFQVQPVYFCKVASNPYGYYLSVYNTKHPNNYMSVKYAPGDGMNYLRTSFSVGTASILYWAGADAHWIVDGDLETFNTLQEAAEAFMNMFPSEYVNIQYVGNGCSIAGPSYVMEGTGISASVTLPIGAALSASNISVTKNGTPIDFNYNPQRQQIAFTAI